MYFKIFIFNLLFIVVAPSLFAQTDHAWIGTGKVRARITPTGIHRDAEGGFLLERGLPGQPAKNLLSHLTLWVGGFDPGVNLKIACEMNEPVLKSDWQGGFRGVANSGKVWKVTLEQIQAHLSDYQDNGVIDNPIPEIFSWPGNGNSFSELHNGFSMDSVHYYHAPFYEVFSSDGMYNPEKGDYPAGPDLNDYPAPPKEIVFAPFYDNGQNKLTKGFGTDMDAHLFAFTLDCQEEDFVKNTIFFEFGGLHNSGTDRLDSLHWGIYADFDIGNPNDDYLGCVIEENSEMVYCYNADTLDDNMIGVNPPAIALMSFDGPFNEYFETIPMSNFMPIIPGGFYAGFPTYSNEFYNFLTSTWRNGIPLTAKGIGYNPGIPSLPPRKKAFPNHPTDPSGWSELAEHNPLGNRSCVLSYGPTRRLLPQQNANPIQFALTVSDKVGFKQKLEHFISMRDLQGYVFDHCFDCLTPFDSLCSAPVSVKEIAPIARVTPNPTTEFVSLKNPGIGIHKVMIFNALGEESIINPPQSVNEDEIIVSLNNLPDGVYFLQWFSRDGRRGCEKVVKN
ncbi:MAG: T9SS type A sorting domain-containing protein [Saprospiraceae bacterium]|nr:T9SS type A sorting domain-containing protein [Saprospiraceae bacterium]